MQSIHIGKFDIACIFQMVLLYRDPQGEKIDTSTMKITTSTTQTGTKSNTEWEMKLASLEKTIANLRNENEALKVSYILFAHACICRLLCTGYIIMTVVSACIFQCYRATQNQLTQHKIKYLTEST